MKPLIIPVYRDEFLCHFQTDVSFYIFCTISLGFVVDNVGNVQKRIPITSRKVSCEMKRGNIYIHDSLHLLLHLLCQRMKRLMEMPISDIDGRGPSSESTVLSLSTVRSSFSTGPSLRPRSLRNRLLVFSIRTIDNRHSFFFNF